MSEGPRCGPETSPSRKEAGRCEQARRDKGKTIPPYGVDGGYSRAMRWFRSVT